MSEILFIRHAETDMAGTFCGHSDPELNANGNTQLIELVSRIQGENVGLVYTSDLQRAHATGIAVTRAFDISCHVRTALREINFGQWEGLSWEEIEERDGDFARRWVAEYPHLTAPGGESFCDFERRVLDEINLLSIEAESKDCNIVVVTHAGVLRTVLRALHGCSEADAWEQTRSYCSIVRHTITGASLAQTIGVRP